MSKREAFLLRTDPKVLDALRRWARDDLRSVNAQLDFVLRQALRRAGRFAHLEDDTEAGSDSAPAPAKEDEPRD